MNIGEWLDKAEKRLLEAGTSTARLDALVLLEDALGQDRALLLAHPEAGLEVANLRKLNRNLAQRERHVPLAYIRGKTEFYGREFAVNPYVLEPRPESETMIDLLKGLGLGAGANIADMGSGSGALGVTAVLELGLQRADFYDIDPETLDVARVNARKYGVTGQFVWSDIFADSSGTYDAVLANLPYVPDDFHINEAAKAEPRIAIFGGPDGLDVYRKLFAQAAELAMPPRYILTEALPPQHPDLSVIAREHGYEMVREEDFIQVFTVRGRRRR